LSDTLERAYEDTRRAAHAAETTYLAAVKQQRSLETLTELAAAARDSWLAASAVCALGEDTARAPIGEPRSRHRLDLVSAAWSDVRNWAALGEEAAGRGEFLGALVTAHAPAISATVRVRSTDASEAAGRLTENQPSITLPHH
jgi:hypothetical protein